MIAPDIAKLLRGLVLASGAIGAAALILVLATAIVFAQTPGAGPSYDTALHEAMDDYVGFAPYDAGLIAPAQISKALAHDLVFIDTRTREEYEQATIKGAIHIEWRDVFARIDEIPSDKPTVLFCNSGALSAQAAFGLRVMGYENILILQTGFQGWTEHKAAL